MTLLAVVAVEAPSADGCLRPTPFSTHPTLSTMLSTAGVSSAGKCNSSCNLGGALVVVSCCCSFFLGVDGAAFCDSFGFLPLRRCLFFFFDTRDGDEERGRRHGIVDCWKGDIQIDSRVCWSRCSLETRLHGFSQQCLTSQVEHDLHHFVSGSRIQRDKPTSVKTERMSTLHNHVTTNMFLSTLRRLHTSNWQHPSAHVAPEDTS